MHSVVDILGLNAVSRKILSNAAFAISGMAKHAGEIRPEKPIIGLTSFGFITEGAMHVKGMLERLGYEVAPFHANGTGGMAMEDLVNQGLISGVLDFALHEFADQLYGGYCGNIGPERLESAARKGIPQVVVPGGLDCIVLEFDSVETMPLEFRDRNVFWYSFGRCPHHQGRLEDVGPDHIGQAQPGERPDKLYYSYERMVGSGRCKRPTLRTGNKSGVRCRDEASPQQRCQGD